MMPKIAPFRAIRYDLSNSKLGSAVCPPYDIIGESLANKLRKIEENAIRIELPEGDGDSKYGRAKQIWDEWNEKGILSKDPSPAFYLYEQIFSVNMKRYSRKGFFCELSLEKPGSGSVLRHELTLSKPKEDRLKLLRALRVNTSPIFGLFQDRGKKICKILEVNSVKKPSAQFRDREGVVHKLWMCEDEKTIKVIQDHLEKHPVVIADGHHRYETAWNYFKESGDKGSRKVLFYLSTMEDPGIVIFPTHRVLKTREPDFYELVERAGVLKKVFAVETIIKGDIGKTGLLRPRGRAMTTFFVISDGRKYCKVIAKSGLALRRIHECLLPEIGKDGFTYLHREEEALRLASKMGAAAILVPPTSAQELYSVVSKGELMPQKSTYFYPKVITGLVFRSLD